MGNHIREERIQKFCYDFALMMRRITGKTPEGKDISQDELHRLEQTLSNLNVTNVMNVTDVTEDQKGQEKR